VRVRLLPLSGWPRWARRLVAAAVVALDLHRLVQAHDTADLVLVPLSIAGALVLFGFSEPPPSGTPRPFEHVVAPPPGAPTDEVVALCATLLLRLRPTLPHETRDTLADGIAGAYLARVAGVHPGKRWRLLRTVLDDALLSNPPPPI
jgi:hypothetical protein